MSRLAIYSLKEMDGKFVLGMDLTKHIQSVEHGKHIMIDAPGTGLKKFAWYPYIVKNYIFDNGHVFFMIARHKQISRQFALQYLLDYRRDGRKNKKEYLQV